MTSQDLGYCRYIASSPTDLISSFTYLITFHVKIMMFCNNGIDVCCAGKILLNSYRYLLTLLYKLHLLFVWPYLLYLWLPWILLFTFLLIRLCFFYLILSDIFITFLSQPTFTYYCPSESPIHLFTLRLPASISLSRILKVWCYFRNKNYPVDNANIIIPINAYWILTALTIKTTYMAIIHNPFTL